MPLFSRYHLAAKFKEDASIFVWHTILLITFERRLQPIGFRIQDLGFNLMF